MTYEIAKEIGFECGLKTPAEVIRNIEIHQMNIFAYSEIEEEIQELHMTAEADLNMPIEQIMNDETWENTQE